MIVRIIDVYVVKECIEAFKSATVANREDNPRAQDHQNKKSGVYDR